MATLYVKHTGSNTAPYDTWAKAATTLKTAVEAGAAGDTIYVASTHSESNGAAVTITSPGTPSAPQNVLCVVEATPPTTLATGALVSTSGAFGLTLFTSGCVYCYGIKFSAGVGSGSTINFLVNDANATTASFQQYENCHFDLATTGAGAIFAFGSTGSAAMQKDITLVNCTLELSATGQEVNVRRIGLIINGGSFAATTSTPAGGLFVSDYPGDYVLVSGMDLSNLGATVDLVNSAFNGEITFKDCKLPASWSGSLVNAAMTGQGRARMHNCDASDTNYRIAARDVAGSVVSETTIVRTGGASDGTTPLSWKVVTESLASFPLMVFTTPEMVVWNDTVGSSKTVTVEVLTDGVTLKDDECWLEVMYLGTSGVPLGSWVSDAKADVLATAANQTSSTETWTTTGLASPVKQKLSVTFTPQEKGFIHARVCLAKPSTTVYVDPYPTVS